MPIDDVRMQDWVSLAKKLDLSPLAGRSFLVTGGSGLIGSYIAGTIAIANQRNALGCRLVCVSNKPPRHKEGIEWLNVDLSLPFTIKGDYDYIFHGACYAQPIRWLSNRMSLIDLNVLATRQLLEISSRSNGAFMFCSTSDVYGDPAPDLAPIPETYTGGPDTLGKRAAYGESKRLGEVLCSLFREDAMVRAYAIRISHLYGPGIGLDDGRVFADFMRQALSGKPISLQDSGNAIKTLGYISDAVSMMFNILLYGKQAVYNVGGVDRLSVYEIAQLIAGIAGNVPVILPQSAASSPQIGTDGRITMLDLSRYTAEFGPPPHTDITTGFSRMIEWNRRIYKGPETMLCG